MQWAKKLLTRHNFKHTKHKSWWIREVETKIPSARDLLTNSVLNTETGEFENNALDTETIEIENKIPVITNLVNKTDYEAKVPDIENIYITTSDYIKFTSDITDKTKRTSQQIWYLQLRKKIWIKHKTCNTSNKSRFKGKTRTNGKTANIWFTLFSR